MNPAVARNTFGCTGLWIAGVTRRIQSRDRLILWYHKAVLNYTTQVSHPPTILYPSVILIIDVSNCSTLLKLLIVIRAFEEPRRRTDDARKLTVLDCYFGASRNDVRMITEIVNARQKEKEKKRIESWSESTRDSLPFIVPPLVLQIVLNSSTMMWRRNRRETHHTELPPSHHECSRNLIVNEKHNTTPQRWRD